MSQVFQIKNCFYCNKCRVTAKLNNDGENGEKYVILSQKEHKCKRIKYETEKEIDVAPKDVKFNNNDDESKPTKNVFSQPELKEEEVRHFEIFKFNSLKECRIRARLIKCWACEGLIGGASDNCLDRTTSRHFDSHRRKCPGVDYSDPAALELAEKKTLLPYTLCTAIMWQNNT
uniref:Uncharacterized protein n=1 Tax=Panagrolaimus sp. ES5 TaxID=591445 RepID=A0AC34GCM5_9BILA